MTHSFPTRRSSDLVEAPVHGFEAAIHKPFFQNAGQRAKLVGFVAEIHGQVGMLPVGQNAQALEVGALPVDLFQGIGSGLGLDLFHGKILAVFLFDLDRSEEHSSELQSLMRISYAVFCLKKKKNK